MKVLICCLLLTLAARNVNSFEYDYLFDPDKFEEIRELYPHYDEVYAPYGIPNVFNQETPNVENQATPIFFHQEEPYVFSEETPITFNPEATHLFNGEEVIPATEKAETSDANKLPVQNDVNVKPVQNNKETSTESTIASPSTATEETNTNQNSAKPFYDIKDAPELFKKFIKDYDKEYKDEDDYNKHFENFVENLKKINKLNKEEDGTTFDINFLADLGKGESILG